MRSSSTLEPACFSVALFGFTLMSKTSRIPSPRAPRRSSRSMRLLGTRGTASFQSPAISSTTLSGEGSMKLLPLIGPFASRRRVTTSPSMVSTAFVITCFPDWAGSVLLVTRVPGLTFGDCRPGASAPRFTLPVSCASAAGVTEEAPAGADSFCAAAFPSPPEDFPAGAFPEPEGCAGRSAAETVFSSWTPSPCREAGCFDPTDMVMASAGGRGGVASDSADDASAGGVSCGTSRETSGKPSGRGVLSRRPDTSGTPWDSLEMAGIGS